VTETGLKVIVPPAEADVGSPPAWERAMGGTSWEEQRGDVEGKVEARKTITEAPLSRAMGESLGRTLARI
jgi:hypothetical protein